MRKILGWIIVYLLVFIYVYSLIMVPAIIIPTVFGVAIGLMFVLLMFLAVKLITD